MVVARSAVGLLEEGAVERACSLFFIELRGWAAGCLQPASIARQHTEKLLPPPPGFPAAVSTRTSSPPIDSVALPPPVAFDVTTTSIKQTRRQDHVHISVSFRVLTTSLDRLFSPTHQLTRPRTKVSYLKIHLIYIYLKDGPEVKKKIKIN